MHATKQCLRLRDPIDRGVPKVGWNQRTGRKRSPNPGLDQR
jgi:hypothetical protein